MGEPVLHKYLDFGERALANLTLASGERVLLSLVPTGFALHRLHLAGYLPGRRLFAAAPDGLGRLVRALAREDDRLAALPRARTKHRDDGHMMEFMDAAIRDLKAVAEHRPVPGAVEAFDTENPPPRPLALLTRFALMALDAAGLARQYERLSNVT